MKFGWRVTLGFWSESYLIIWIVFSSVSNRVDDMQKAFVHFDSLRTSHCYHNECKKLLRILMGMPILWLWLKMLGVNERGIGWIWATVFLILNWVQNIKPLCDLLELLPYFVGVCVLLLSFADVLEFSF